MNSDFADLKRIIGYAASTLTCGVRRFRSPLVCVFGRSIQLSRREEFHVAMLDASLAISKASFRSHIELREMIAD